MAGSVYQIEDVFMAVFGGVIHSDWYELDGDSPFTFQ